MNKLKRRVKSLTEYGNSCVIVSHEVETPAVVSLAVFNVDAENGQVTPVAVWIAARQVESVCDVVE